MAGLLGAGMPDTGLLSPATVNPLMARKAAAQRSLLPVDSPFAQYNASYPQTWGQFGQNMAQAYPTPATGASRDQILGAVTQAAINTGPLATVFHGSPHRFDKFDASKIGTGEGAQAYGHGLYFAESPDVARSYQKTLSKYGEIHFGDGSKVSVPDLPYNSPEQIAGQIWMNKPNLADAKYALSNLSEKHLGAPKEQVMAELERLNKRGASLSGSLYKVDLPDEHIAKMLDWDKPLSQQSAEVRKFFEPLVAPIRKVEGGTSAGWGDLSGPRTYDPTGQELLRLLSPKGGGMDASTVLNGGLGPQISAQLQKQGIPGIRYLDGGSRAGGQGTSNFVVFPGNEGLLKILERQ